MIATIPNGTKLGTEDSIKINLQTTNGIVIRKFYLNTTMDLNSYPPGQFQKDLKISKFPKMVR